ncbi:uncharacterized protein C8Q71DRAFT_725187 [Rhodofomes roseus]|uniref:Uncharacterized protein n=1 Tax=Rhodofomes roseus TaxID=34475 RepID=A0ABQ8KBM7_9APHY|nr:uncharacterized protein C8Q71DRAFT_725187 [Rhodofomes roseus]KAH9834662.1 hypothetical protein C8Q71DRAFT_725187 [Rhodofomes roseus]
MVPLSVVGMSSFTASMFWVGTILDLDLEIYPGPRLSHWARDKICPDSVHACFGRTLNRIVVKQLSWTSIEVLTLPFAKCRITPTGLQSVKDGLDHDGLGQSYPSRLHSAALAFLVSGVRKDGRHSLPNDAFHPDCKAAKTPGSRDNYNMRRELLGLALDTITTYDRLSGGATIVVSIPGSLRPGSDLQLENIQTDVYFPPGIFNELPELQPVLSQLIQLTVELIGMPVCRRWRRAAEHAGWDLSSSDDGPNPNGPFPIFPVINTSSHYRIWGRRTGELEQLLTAAGYTGSLIQVSVSPRRDTSSPHTGAPEPANKATSSDAACLAADEVGHLRVENAQLRDLVRRLKVEIAALRGPQNKTTDTVRLLFGPDVDTSPSRSTPSPVMSAATSPPSSRGTVTSTVNSPSSSRGSFIPAISLTRPPSSSGGRAPPSSIILPQLVDCSPLTAKPAAPATPPVARSQLAIAATPTTASGRVFAVRASASSDGNKAPKKDAPSRTTEVKAMQGGTRPLPAEPSPPNTLAITPQLGSPFRSPSAKPRMTCSIRSLPSGSPVSISDSESSVGSSSRPLSPVSPFLSPSSPSESVPGTVIIGFGYRSARYLANIGLPKYSNYVLDDVAVTFAAVLWPEELRRRLSISEEQASGLADAMVADARDQLRLTT